MAQNSSLPLKFNTKNLLTITQLNNYFSLTDYNLTDYELETYICDNLVHETLPQDLINTFPSPGNNSLDILSDENGSELIGKTAFINNDTLLNNELFGMKCNYLTLSEINPDSTSIPIGDIPNSVKLDPSFNSLFNSNLKIDVVYNNDDQYTDSNNNNNGVWALSGNRSSMQGIYNTFSAVNSVYNQDNGDSPFYIRENDNNTYSLGLDSTKWFIQSYNGVSVGDGEIQPQSITTENTLSYNNIVSTVLQADYTFDQFNKYQVIQGQPTIDTTLSDSGSALPFQYVYNGSVIDLSSSTFDFSGVFQQTYGVQSGFNMVLDVLAGGAYSLEQNPFVSLDQESLTRDATNPYVQLEDLESLSHILTVVNGTTTLSSATSSTNPSHITISDEYETLDSSFNGTDGLINIIVDNSNNRVYYTDGSNVSGNYGTKTNLTTSVNVAYPGEASPSIADFNDGEILVTEDVNFYVEILAPSTVYPNVNAFLNEDLSRNLAYDASTVLVIASQDMPTSGLLVQSDFSFNSYLSVANNEIYIISVENQSILTQDSELIDANNDPVVGTTATVTMTNIELVSSSIPYSDFEVRLNTKTIGDLSNALELTNGWSIVGNEATYLQGTALQTGVIHDDYLFMTTDPAVPINMNYAFQIANPTCASIQAIKRQIRISFFDLSFSDISDNGLTNSTTETEFFLDDQDITLNNKVIVDTSISICNNIASINPAYSVGTYTFQKHVQTITYIASFQSKFQFYTNVYFQTPEITEQATYYKILKNGIEQPSYLLKWFTDGCNNGNLLSNVYVALVGEPIYTTFDYTQHACSILTASIWGKDDTDTFVQLPSSPIDIDPFFRQNGVVINLLDGQPRSNGHANISVHFPSNIPVESSSYTIVLAAGLGENQSLTAKSYIYTAGGTELDAYSNYGFIYNDFYNTLMSNEPLLTTVVDRVDGNTVLTIKDDGDNILAVIQHPDTYIYNYNIISSLAPLVQVDYTVGTNATVSDRIIAHDGTISILDGVTYNFNESNAVVGANETFALVSDSFNLKFVNDNDYLYNTYSTTQKFDCNSIQIALQCSADANTNYARSVTFDQLRGYQYVAGGDVITIDRTITTATFSLDLGNGNTATQSISNIYNGSSLTLTNVEYDGTIYSIGLVLNFDKSMLTSEDPLTYPIDLTVAVYNLYVNGSLVDTNYLTQNQNLLSPYFNGVQPASIYSATSYSMTVTYTVPDLVINSYNTTDYYKYIGDPLSVSEADWSFFADVSFNTLLNSGYLVIPGFQIQQYSLANVFYSSTTSYFVIAPPVVSVYGYTDFSNNSINSLPIYPNNSNNIASLHINHDVNSYSIAPSYLLFTTITFYEDFIKPYYEYANVKNDSTYDYTYNKYFRLEGNYVTTKLYLNGTASSGANSPEVVDAINNPIDTLIDGKLLSQLTDNSPFNNNTVNVSVNNYTNNVTYNQFLPSANKHNSTANIIFNMGNYFTPQSTTYLRLIVNIGTEISFYQSNLVYDVSGTSGTYYIVIDRYNTDSVVNYSEILQTASINELVFPISSHLTKQFMIDNSTIIDNSGNISDISDILNSIQYVDISNAFCNY